MSDPTFAERADEYEDEIAMCVLHHPSAALMVPNTFRFTNAHRQRIFDHVLRGGSLVESDLVAELGKETGAIALAMLEGYGGAPVNLPNRIRVCVMLRDKASAARSFRNVSQRLAPNRPGAALQFFRRRVCE